MSVFLLKISHPKGGMYELSGLDHMSAKVDALTQKIDNLTITHVATVTVVTPNCVIYRVQRHVSVDC